MVIRMGKNAAILARYVWENIAPLKISKFVLLISNLACVREKLYNVLKF